MTKRKYEALSPEDFDCLSAWALNPNIKFGSRISVRGGARAFARKTFESALPALKYCWTYGDEKGTQYLVRGNFPGKRGITAQFNLSELRRELSAEHFVLFNELCDALDEQSRMVHYAIGVAKLELGATKKRSKSGLKRATELKKITADSDAELKIYAEKIRKTNPKWKISDIARSLSERHGRGNFDVIRRKLSRLLRD